MIFTPWETNFSSFSAGKIGRSEPSLTMMTSSNRPLQDSRASLRKTEFGFFVPMTTENLRLENLGTRNIPDCLEPTRVDLRRRPARGRVFCGLSIIERLRIVLGKLKSDHIITSLVYAETILFTPSRYPRANDLRPLLSRSIPPRPLGPPGNF